MKKKQLIIVFCIMVLLGFELLYAGTGAYGMDIPEERELYALSAVLMDGESGRILYDKNGSSFLSNASTTKILTCIVALENASMEEQVQVSQYAASMPKVKLYMKKGESYELGDLLYSLMLESHNDTAAAIAEHVGSGLLDDAFRKKAPKDRSVTESKQAVDAFMKLMNAKAKEIGCENTLFLTPNGLDASMEMETDGEKQLVKHGTTAADLALIMRYCVGQSPQKERFLEITGTGNYSFYGGKDRNFQLTNHNQLLYTMEGAISGKTGFTNEAGYCYVGAVRRGDKFLIVALLGCGWPNHKNYKWKDTGKLMNYGMEEYTFYPFEQLEINRLPIEEIYVEKGRDAEGRPVSRIPLKIREEENTDQGSNGLVSQGILLSSADVVKVHCVVLNSLTAPVSKGEKVGEIQYLVDNKVYKTVDVVTAKEVRSTDYEWCLLRILEQFWVR